MRNVLGGIAAAATKYRVALGITMTARVLTIVGCGVILLSLVACDGRHSAATPPMSMTASIPVIRGTPVQVNESLSIVVPQGYHFRDEGSFGEGSNIHLYQIGADTKDIYDKADRYVLWFYPRDSGLPFGFGTSSPAAVLDTITKNLSDSHYEIQESTVSSTEDGSTVRIRATRPFSNELAQLYFLLRSDNSLISLTGGASLSRVPATQQVDVFTQLVSTLSTR